MANNEYWNENWNIPWQNLLYYMGSRKVSFKQLAERSGVKQSTIEGWRRDETRMFRARAEYVVRVCKTLDVKPSYMLGLEADPRRVEKEEIYSDTSHEVKVLREIMGTEVFPEGPPPRIERKKRVENRSKRLKKKDKK